MLLAPSLRGRIPVIIDEGTTVCNPSELIDVVVTERGIAVNPRRQDLLDAVAVADLPIRPIEDLKAELNRRCGEPARYHAAMSRLLSSSGSTAPCSTPYGR